MPVQSYIHLIPSSRIGRRCRAELVLGAFIAAGAWAGGFGALAWLLALAGGLAWLPQRALFGPLVYALAWHLHSAVLLTR